MTEGAGTDPPGKSDGEPKHSETTGADTVGKRDTPAQQAPAGTPAATETSPIVKAASDAVVKLIGFIATGTGFVTLLGVTGALVTWVRLREANLPATQVIGVIGIDHLVADGALALSLWVLL